MSGRFGTDRPEKSPPRGKSNILAKSGLKRGK